MTQVALRRVSRVVNGGTPTAEPDFWDGDVPWATPVDLGKNDGGTIAETERMLTPLGVARGSTEAPKGSVLLSCRAPIGYTALTTRAMAFNQGCKSIVPLSGVDGRYLQYTLISAKSRLAALGSGSTFLELASDSLASLSIPRWPLEEQRRIADFLDDRVARIDRIIAARREQQRMLAGLRGEAVLNDLAGVEVVPLRRVLSYVRTGGTPPPEADAESGLPWYTPGDFDDNLTMKEPTRLVSGASVTVFPPRSVLLVGIGATVGKVAWINHRASGNQQITGVAPISGAMKSRFLLHQLAARADELRKTAPSATLPIINNEALKSLPIACPPVDEQRLLLRGWDHLRDQAGSAMLSIQRSIDLLTECKQSLITAAVTGELDVTTAGSGIPG